MQLHELSPLFETIQRAHLFPDDKTFPDATPRRRLADIASAYSALSRDNPAPLTIAQLRAFVTEHFNVPDDAPPSASAGPAADVTVHIKTLWKTLRREPAPANPGSTLLPLPHPYIVPGGRFREIYYWDSYFTMLGLRASGEETMIRHMLANFLHLQARHALIPNGNRAYYLSRSQPPLLAMMVELAVEHAPAILAHFHDALAAEHAYWMDCAAPTSHVVELPDGSRLNRYWDQLDTPRPESFNHDEALLQKTTRPPPELFRDLRSAAESGWDFSSRWLADPARLETIRTTRLVPVDLNCFLWKLEHLLSRTHATAGNTDAARRFENLCEARRRALEKYCWSPVAGFFCDYDLDTRAPSPALTLAGVTPLYFGLASETQQHAAAETLAKHFLAPGGLVTTLRNTGQQWDWPNGWAPLQWLAIRGLEKANAPALAAESARRWIRLNRAVYARTGRLLEKYNVIDTADGSGEGGEYSTQQGFGWTNGVLLDLLRDYCE